MESRYLNHMIYKVIINFVEVSLVSFIKIKRKLFYLL